MVEADPAQAKPLKRRRPSRRSVYQEILGGTFERVRCVGDA